MTAATNDVLRTISLRLTPAAWREAFDDLPVASSMLECMLLQDRHHLELLDRFAEKRGLPHRSSLPSLCANETRMFLCTQSELQSAYRMAGLSCWGGALATEVDGARLGTLHAHFGRDALLHAQRWQPATRQMVLPADLEDIVDVVERAGQACMHAWHATLPKAWRAWIAAISPARPGTDDLPDGIGWHSIAIWRDAMGEATHGY